MLEFAARAVGAPLTQENPRRYKCVADPLQEEASMGGVEGSSIC